MSTVTDKLYGGQVEIPDEEERRWLLVQKSVVWGGVGGLALLSVYFLILTVANSFVHAIEELREIWYWVTPLVLGFSTQVGLYTYIRGGFRLKADTGAATSSMAVAGGMSTTSMVACCAHHLTDILPVLGISAAALFLSRFQDLFMLAGVLSNLIGINLMLRIIQKHGLYRKDGGLLSLLMAVDMRKSLVVVSVVSAAAFSAALYIIL